MTPSSKIKTESLKLLEICVNEEVYARSSKTFSKDLKIPDDLVCSNSQYCNVIQIYYELKVEADIPSDCQDNVALILPITIGSIPLDFHSTLDVEASAPTELLRSEPEVIASAPSLETVPDSRKNCR